LRNQPPNRMGQTIGAIGDELRAMKQPVIGMHVWDQEFQIRAIRANDVRLKLVNESEIFSRWIEQGEVLPVDAEFRRKKSMRVAEFLHYAVSCCWRPYDGLTISERSSH